jgi:asparagine synthase (glutamine-hydrolysing)
MQASNHLGTQHQVVKLDIHKAMEQLPSVIQSIDEPFAINGLIPYAFLCRTVSESGFKVAVGGDGADELFGGYLWQESWWKRHQKQSQKSFLNELVHHLSLSRSSTRSVQNSYIEHFLTISGGLKRSLRDRVGLRSPADQFIDRGLKYASSHCTEESMLYPLFVDQECFLPDHCLVKVDRSSMRFGLEVRVPFLDQELARSVRNLEADILLGNGERKFLLRNLFAGELATLDNNRKKGFSSPIGQWWHLGLKSLASDVFANSELANKSALIRQSISEGYKRNDAASLVNLLSLCLWEDYWLGPRNYCDSQRLGGYVSQ